MKWEWSGFLCRQKTECKSLNGMEVGVFILPENCRVGQTSGEADWKVYTSNGRLPRHSLT